MNISFNKDSEYGRLMPYASSYRFDGEREFTQLEDCVTNLPCERDPGGWEWISVLSKEKYPKETGFCATCSFEGIAAPLIVIAKDVHTVGGKRKFGDYFEIVIWKNGVNIWQMDYDPERKENGGVAWKLRLGVDHSFEEGVKHTISFKMVGNHMHVYADKEHYRLYLPDMYDDFHIGFSLCEGKCALYSMSTE